jgi:hypothetical protein
MADRVFVHVGSPKSGTTYLQTRLWTNRGPLRERGLLLPGAKLFDHNRASIEVRGAAGLDPKSAPVWHRFLRRAAGFAGDLLLTNEWFVLSTAEQRRALVRSVGPERTHVIVTARNAVRLVPAAWQETLKLGSGHDLDAFVTSLDGDDGRWTWRALDPAEIVEAWSEHVPPDQVHLVTVPGDGAAPGELWDRFAAAAAFDPSGLDETRATANESLGVQVARWLQDAGPALRTSVDAAHSPWTDTYRWLRRYLSHRLLVPLGGDPIGLEPALVDKLNERAERSVARVLASGCLVHGDVGDLRHGTNKRGSRLPSDVSADELHKVGMAVAAALLHDVRARTRSAQEPEATDEEADE